MKLWQKNYHLDQEIESFTVGDDPLLDQQLVKYDCLASMAHVRMLQKIGILSKAESSLLLRGLARILELDRKGRFKIAKQDEDCHTAIEGYLIRHCGQAGKKIHTYRSRNDQVLAALRLLYKECLQTIRDRLKKTDQTIRMFKNRNGRVPIPGFTHTRKAMPSSIGLWAGAILEALKDDQTILIATMNLMDQSPLGTGAGYGIPYKIDRSYAQRDMGFRRMQKNPLYCQNSRGKFEAFMLHALSMILFDVNKAATDLIFFSLPEFGFFTLPDEFLTGSSMMPHKKNPDVLELLRGSFHLLLSCEQQVQGLTANLISGYHRDFQLTKEPALKGLGLALKSLTIFELVFQNLQVDKSRCRQAMTEELFLTQQAYTLVGKGLPFREAYQNIAKEFFKNKGYAGSTLNASRFKIKKR